MTNALLLVKLCDLTGTLYDTELQTGDEAAVRGWY